MSWIDAQGRMTGSAVKIFHAVLLLTVVCLLVPLVPAMPAGGLDPSWCYAMNQAVAQGLKFGQEMIFTFGPYAGLYTNVYHPATDAMVMLGGIHLALCFWLALCVLIRGVRWPWVVLLGVALVMLSYSRDAQLFTYPVLVGVVCHETFRQMHRDESAGWPLTLFMALLYSPLGLLPLIKGSMLILCLGVVLVAVWTMTLRGDGRQVLVAVLSPFVTMLLYWCLAGQPLSSLLTYYSAMMPIISGYTEAMSRDGFVHELGLYALSTVMLLWGVFRIERSLLSGWLLVLAAALFLVFKAAYVRHDAHALMGAAFLLFVTVLTLARASTRHAVHKTLLFSGGLAAVLFVSSVCFYSVNTEVIKEQLVKQAVAKGVEVRGFKLLPRSQQARMVFDLVGPKALVRAVWDSLYFPMAYTPLLEAFDSRVLHPDTLPRRFQAQMVVLQQEMPLPKLSGTVDIYSFNQSYLIASGNHWHPRPVLQSYSVYTPALVAKNLAHLTSEDAPDHVLFRSEAIDMRLPSMEEGISWSALLHRYQPVALSSDLLHLQKVANAPDWHALPVLSSTRAQLGQMVSVPHADGLVYMEMDIKPTLLGRLFTLFFKPHPVLITLELVDGTSRTYRLVPGMVKTGVLLSPLVENTTEFGFLFGPPSRLASKQVKAFSVNATGRGAHWARDMDVVFKVDQPSSPVEVEKFFQLDKVLTPQALDLSASQAHQCFGRFDMVNGITPAPAELTTDGLVSVAGWVAKPVTEGVMPENVWLVLEDEADHVQYVATHPTHGRQGRSAHSYLFTSVADLHALSGRFTLGLAYQDGHAIKHCPEFRLPLTIQHQTTTYAKAP